MTKQEMFDAAYRGVVTQGKLCKVAGCCLYNHNGMHCAIGWIIPSDVGERWDEESINFTDGAMWDSLAEKELEAIGITLDDETFDFLRDLQFAHDNVSTLMDFKQNMKEIADLYGLRIPEL